ncbi:hypothetical protein P8452_18751 [Trifolium repens]|nr:hypothetical protein P8452_18751 [Trifolium repens]
MDEGLRQSVNSVDLEASRCLGVDERLRLLLEVQLLIVVLFGVVFVNDDDLIIRVYVKGVGYLRARIQQLENEATKGKKSHEDAATRKGTLKKEVEAVVSFTDKLTDVEKGLEDAQKETKVLGHQNNDLSEKVFGVRCEGVWDSDYSEGEDLCC